MNAMNYGDISYGSENKENENSSPEVKTITHEEADSIEEEGKIYEGTFTLTPNIKTHISGTYTGEYQIFGGERIPHGPGHLMDHNLDQSENMGYIGTFENGEFKSGKVNFRKDDYTYTAEGEFENDSIYPINGEYKRTNVNENINIINVKIKDGNEYYRETYYKNGRVLEKDNGNVTLYNSITKDENSIIFSGTNEEFEQYLEKLNNEEKLKKGLNAQLEQEQLLTQQLIKKGIKDFENSISISKSLENGFGSGFNVNYELDSITKLENLNKLTSSILEMNKTELNSLSSIINETIDSLKIGLGKGKVYDQSSSQLINQLINVKELISKKINN